MKRENEHIRKAAREAGLPIWRVASAIGVSEQTLIRWFRFPLPEEKEACILEAIATLSREV